MTKLAIASDHAGYPLKEALKEARPEIEWIDLGTHSTESVDYPDYANKLAECIKNNETNRGVLICGSALGISMAANRHSHIRAAVCTDATMAKLTRLHNNANVLCLGQRITGIAVALDCVDIFLSTEYEGGRHDKRVTKLS